MDLKIVSYNVRGLGNYQIRREIFYYLNHKDFDIALLQETHSSKNIEKLWKTQWGDVSTTVVVQRKQKVWQF